MTNRRGFALLAVLWLVAALGIVAAVGLAAGRLGAATTRNRILLTRASWAREGCVAILMARLAEDTSTNPDSRPLRELPRVDLGRGTWCEARLEDPTSLINLNVADSTTLAHLLRSPDQAALLLAWRRAQGPLQDVAELRFIRGFDSSSVTALAEVATSRGSGTVNLNEASPEVLGALSGLPREALGIILSRRSARRPVTSLDDLLASLSPQNRAVMLSDYATWLGRVAFSTGQLVAHVTGGVDATPILSKVTLTLAPVVGRPPAVLRRESE